MTQHIPEYQAEAGRECKKIHDAIRSGVTRDALKALKKAFGYDLPAFQYRRKGFELAPDAGNNAELIALHAAVRDGQREVITYIAQLLNSDDE